MQSYQDFIKANKCEAAPNDIRLFNEGQFYLITKEWLEDHFSELAPGQNPRDFRNGDELKRYQTYYQFGWLPPDSHDPRAQVPCLSWEMDANESETTGRIEIADGLGRLSFIMDDTPAKGAEPPSKLLPLGHPVYFGTHEYAMRRTGQDPRQVKYDNNARRRLFAKYHREGYPDADASFLSRGSKSWPAASLAVRLGLLKEWVDTTYSDSDLKDFESKVYDLQNATKKRGRRAEGDYVDFSRETVQKAIDAVKEERKKTPIVADPHGPAKEKSRKLITGIFVNLLDEKTDGLTLRQINQMKDAIRGPLTKCIESCMPAQPGKDESSDDTVSASADATNSGQNG